MHSKLIIESCMSEESELGSSEAEIKHMFLTRALDRNVGSHGRPGLAGSDYMVALATIAAACEPDEEGFFVVPIELEFPDGTGDRFDPYKVLQRSGLVSFGAPRAATQR